MPKFILAEEVDDLSYDFSTTTNPDGPKGTIPDPSSKQITKFQKRLRSVSRDLRKLLGKLDDDEMSDTEILAEALDSADDALEESQEAILEAVAEVCSQKPSLEEIQALPYRAQQVFIGWVTGTFLDPKASTPATK